MPVIVAVFVFPTCVGVNRAQLPERLADRRIPHVRGGEPGLSELLARVNEYSPRAWG